MLLGSMSVSEMRASTLAARALCLEPRYCRVPCVVVRRAIHLCLCSFTLLGSVKGLSRVKKTCTSMAKTPPRIQDPSKQIPTLILFLHNHPFLSLQTLKETGWYDPNRLLGSMAVPEMRASTLAARALCLEPRYCRVPCVGGTEGESLVPLFSKAVEYFDFAEVTPRATTGSVPIYSKTVLEHLKSGLN